MAVNQVLSLSQRASEIFESSEPNEKRQLLNYLLQNCRLNERNLLFELKKPFDALVKYNKCPEMLPLLDAFRTFDWKGLNLEFGFLKFEAISMLN
ncbi:MAG: hypothetical protein Q8N37_04785 [bacterium]|nr:hypothetical protein [bacterium]